jgi:hypothetical protein
MLMQLRRESGAKFAEPQLFPALEVKVVPLCGDSAFRSPLETGVDGAPGRFFALNGVRMLAGHEPPAVGWDGLTAKKLNEGYDGAAILRY